VSTVLPGMSATNKPRVGRLRITPGRAPLVPRTEPRSHLVIRHPAGPCGSAVTSRPHYGHQGLVESDISSVLRYNPWKYIMIAYRAHDNSENSITE